MTRWPTRLVVLLLLAAGCAGTAVVLVHVPGSDRKQVAPLGPPVQLYLGSRIQHWSDFAFDGGSIEFDVHQFHGRVAQVARNRYAAPLVMKWELFEHENLESDRPFDGIALLPTAPTPSGVGPNVLLVQMRQVDLARPYRTRIKYSINFGDPMATPASYVYGLPFPAGRTFRIGQGFHGTRTHTGTNEYALDFECPEGTPVLAMRPGLVVTTNASAKDGGMNVRHVDWREGNFVLVLHEDGTIGQYLHLAPGGVSVKAGQSIERGAHLGLSGSTGFASGPHLHVHVSTSATDGELRTFPFRFAVAPDREEAPLAGEAYHAWESH